MSETTKAPSSARDSAATRWFFTVCAVVFTTAAVLGFHHFYFEGRAYPGREIPPPIRTLVIAHGVLMTLWLALSIVQPWLIARGARLNHRRLGAFGACLAAGVVYFGFRVGVHSARTAPPDLMLWGLAPPSFMAVPVVSVAIFVVFTALAVAWRKRPERHRAMIFAANLAVLSAAISRIDAVNALYLGTRWERWFGPFFSTQVLGLVLVTLRLLLVRRLESALVVAFLVQTALAAGIVAIAPTAPWVAFAKSLMG